MKMKIAASRLRQKMSCSKRSWCDATTLHSAASLRVDQLEVDVLERRAAHLELLELAPAAHGLAGELVQRARRLVRLQHDELAVPPEADLGLGVSPISSAGVPRRTIRPSRITATRSASCWASSR